MMNLKEIEISLDNTPKIKLNGLEKAVENNPLDFLINFFRYYNNTYNTVLVSNPEVMETDTHRRRSLGDVYKICKYYFPNCTLFEIVDCLYNKLFVEEPEFNSAICNDIKKRVFFLYRYSSSHDEENAIDEYGNCCFYYKLTLLDNSIEWWNLISSLVTLGTYEKIDKFKIKYKKLYGKECNEKITKLYSNMLINYNPYYDEDDYDDGYEDDYGDGEY